MYSTICVRFVLICFCYFYAFKLVAQPEISLFTDFGSNNISQGIFLNSSAMGDYRFGKNRIESAILMNLKSNNSKDQPGYRILGSREISIRHKPLEIQGFLLQTSFSDLLRQSNWGVLVKIKQKHWDLNLGTNFRTYTFKKEAVKVYKIDNSASRLSEPRNLMYAFTYYIQPINSAWNLGVSVTNFDYFLINQETNPQFNFKGYYKLNKQISLFAQVWYEPTGIFNLYTNYFGLFSRTGINWNLR